MDLNLEKLKQEVEEYLVTGGFAVFRSVPQGLEGLPMVLWDVERNPDFHAFLDVAREAGARVIMFATAELAAADLDELEEHLGEADLDRDEAREFKSRIRDLRGYVGETCTLELAFDYNSRLYVFDVQPDWYDDFVTLEEEITDRLSETDLDDDDSLGGYFSKN